MRPDRPAAKRVGNHYLLNFSRGSVTKKGRSLVLFLRMAKSKKNNNKAKLNMSVRDEQRNKLEQMAALENRSVSNLIEVMADERWKRLAEQQGVGDTPRL